MNGLVKLYSARNYLAEFVCRFYTTPQYTRETYYIKGKKPGARTDQEFNQIMNCIKNLEECFLKFFL